MNSMNRYVSPVLKIGFFARVLLAAAVAWACNRFDGIVGWHRDNMIRVQIWFIILILCASVAEAQTSTGTILGRAIDPTKAVVRGAQVTLTEPQTNLTRSQTTGADGSFVFRALPFGVYSLQVTQAGFAKEIVTGIKLDVAGTNNIDITLQPAATARTISVKGTSPLLQVNDSSLSSVIGHAQVETLPLNGRNVIQLAHLAAGVVTSAKGSATERQANYGPGFQVGGQRDNANEILVDGIDISGMELNNYPLAVPPIDSVAEFRVQTSNYSAEFGGNSGAIINIATKRGTNRIHGGLFEYLRNNALDARNYFATSVSPLKRNQFGTTLGGPVILPWLYNGHNKTFWYFSYEGIRQSSSIASAKLLPTAAERAGNFSGTGTTIVDPFTKIPYPNDTIPQNLISSVGQNLIDLYPLPNFSGSTAYNYTNAPAQSFDNDLISTRLDHQLTSKDSMFGRFTINQPKTVSPGLDAAIPGYNQIQKDWNLQIALGNVAILTPHIVNETNFGLVQFDRSRGSQAANVQNWVEQIGITGITPPPYAWAAPSVAIQGLAGVGYGAGNAVFDWSSRSIQIVDNLSIEHDHHNFKTGVTINIKNLDSTQFGTANGGYTFAGVFSAQNPLHTTSANGVADLLLGWPSAYTVQTGPYVERFNYIILGSYFQDNWRVTPRLNMNLGMRWQYFGKPVDHNNNIATFDLTTGEQVLAGQSDSPLPRSLVYPDRTDFAPRLGFAYQLDKNTSIRGAYGLFYAPEVINTFRTLGFQNPFGTTYTLSTRNLTNPTPVFSAADPLAGATPAVSFSTVYGINPHFMDTRVGEWNLSLQHLFTGNVLMEIAYRGSSSTHLSSSLNYNQTNPYPAQPPDFIQNFPYPKFGTVHYYDSNGSGNYNALQLRVQKQMSHGLSFLGSFTWNKSLTNIDESSTGTNYGDEAYLPQVISPLSLNYGNANSGHPKELNLSGVYQLPFLSNSPSFVTRMIGGWSVGFDATFSDGDWLTPGSYGTTATGSRANITGDPNLPRSQRTHLRWYDTSKVTNPLSGQLGNSRKGTIMGSGTNVWNVVLGKSFAMTKNQNLEFRGEFFNLFNHTQFDDPETYANANPQAGVILSASDYGFAQTERVVQLVLRYQF